MGKKLPIITLSPDSFEAIVASYVWEKRPGALAERESFAQEPTFESALRRAALGLTADGKVHSHQRQVSRQARRDWADHLLANIELLRPVETFEQLFSRVESLAIDGIAEMTIYDTAYRIGAKLGLEPRFVYLHSGTRKGAGLLGLGKGRAYLRMEELPPPVLRPGRGTSSPAGPGAGAAV
jgi:hypothetical protein